jgi:hypothetical protein
MYFDMKAFLSSSLATAIVLHAAKLEQRRALTHVIALESPHLTNADTAALQHLLGEVGTQCCDCERSVEMARVKLANYVPTGT